MPVAWEIEGTDEFQEWFGGLSVAARESVAHAVGVLEQIGPALGRPEVDTVKGSRYSNMKELRIQHAGRPYRVFFAFDPRRSGILLIGGCKSGKRWYGRMIAAADGIYERYLEELKQEGLI